jgi:hypothetical protein
MGLDELDLLPATMTSSFKTVLSLYWDKKMQKECYRSPGGTCPRESFTR